MMTEQYFISISFIYFLLKWWCQNSILYRFPFEMVMVEHHSYLFPLEMVMTEQHFISISFWNGDARTAFYIHFLWKWWWQNSLYIYFLLKWWWQNSTSYLFPFEIVMTFWSIRPNTINVFHIYKQQQPTWTTAIHKPRFLLRSHQTRYFHPGTSNFPMVPRSREKQHRSWRDH